MIQKLWKHFLNVLAPQECLLCSCPLDNEALDNDIYDISQYVCQRCQDCLNPASSRDTLLSSVTHNLAPDVCRLQHIVARYAYSPVERSFAEPDTLSLSPATLLYAIKYHGKKHLARALGRELGAILRMLGIVQYHYIVPIPIHTVRRRERGYNQSEHIAYGVADVLSIPVRTSLIYRRAYTLSQTYLSSHERRNNVRTAFAVHHHSRSDINGASLLLIDDILTTGATLNTCATLLAEHGAQRIDAATVFAA
ncbi:MAG: phosphoribosyltransferase family protein [Bacteroidota bacterium]|nr:phosphoribosyltransferase family protein [Candidatus Kapabacteria bacterium]MDW8218928.1 phosphoribosyltransferase family protein [Bacteroidota bacterium]